MQVTPLLTPEEAAELLKISTAQLSNWRSNKKVSIKYVKLGSSVRYKLADVQAYIESNTEQ